ncbi:hypothetical protein BJ508DRAFT_419716 [Ascobolus immersus RN42]|uniref:Uncharacterized protein n=1 Tax=Ascobolus immersus RN42 TaxID=1160509 RepID=A0A3N4HC86_ASCIM|nr:hypothetical protein BJ508DRAFT_419716 [Ascobolus immersus RN42]
MLFTSSGGWAGLVMLTGVPVGKEGGWVMSRCLSLACLSFGYGLMFRSLLLLLVARFMMPL